MIWDFASIFPHNFPTSWCHLFCEVHQSLLQQCTPTTWCCHGVLRLASLPLFPPNITMVIMAKQFYFSLCPHVQLQTVVWLFLWWFWSSGFFLAEWPFRLCRYRTRFTVDLDTFVPVSFSIFTRRASFVVVLRLICTFHTKVRSSLGDRTRLLPERCDGCKGPMVFILAYYCLYRWTWYLQAFGNCSQGWTRRVVYNLFSEVLADFFWFSHDVKERGTELEGRPWNTSTGTPPIDSNDVN